MLPRLMPDGRPRPPVVCLVGSSRFFDAFTRANFAYTLTGHIVLTLAFAPDVVEHGETVGISIAEKAHLDALHMDKVALADVVVVINPGGYIGASTAREIAHAVALRKQIVWMEPLRADQQPSCPQCGARCFLTERSWFCGSCHQAISPSVLPLPSDTPPHTPEQPDTADDLDLKLLLGLDWNRVNWEVRANVIGLLQEAGVVAYADDPDPTVQQL